jgi:uncharacterized protein (DUF433 family)
MRKGRDSIFPIRHKGKKDVSAVTSTCFFVRRVGFGRLRAANPLRGTPFGGAVFRVSSIQRRRLGAVSLTVYSRFNGRENCVVVFRAKVGLIVGMKNTSVVKIDPEIMSGEPCFAGTRVPVRTLLDYLEGSDSLDEFLEDFPTVVREQVIAFLEQSADAMLATIGQTA